SAIRGFLEQQNAQSNNTLTILQCSSHPFAYQPYSQGGLQGLTFYVAVYRNTAVNTLSSTSTGASSQPGGITTTYSYPNDSSVIVNPGYVYPSVSNPYSYSYSARRGIPLTSVKDGTSNTIMIGERPPSPDKHYGWWNYTTGIDTESPVFRTPLYFT